MAEFSEIQPEKLYFAVTDGQFIGVFYCKRKTNKAALFMCAFYADNVIRHQYLMKVDFDWPYTIGDDDDLPDNSWAADMTPIKYIPNIDIEKYYRLFITNMWEDYAQFN